MLSLLSFALKGAAFFFSSFLFWKRLRDDYPSGRVFSFTLVLFLGGTIGNIITHYLPFGEDFSFWLPFFLVFILTLYFTKKLEFRLFEVLDSLVPAWIFFMLFYSLALVEKLDRKPLIEAGLALAALILYNFLKGRYRRFSWYPSGKMGFLGLATLGVYFFARFLVAILLPIVVSFSERRGIWFFTFDFPSAIISLVLSIFFLFAVYLRSGRERAERMILKWKK